MFHLVIAQDLECKNYRIIKSGDYEFLSKYTTKFNDSKEIRNNNKKVQHDFEDIYNDYGDVVIIDEAKNNKRIRVLYKKHIRVVKELLKSQKFMQYIISNRILPVSEWDYRSIMYLRKTEYLKHMKEFLNRRYNYYSTIRVIIKAYENYQKKCDLPTIDAMYKEITKKNKKKNNDDIELSVSYNLNSDVKDSSYYEEINSSYLNGGIEEVFNDYSLDELGSRLNDDDFKKLVKSGYHA